MMPQSQHTHQSQFRRGEVPFLASALAGIGALYALYFAWMGSYPLLDPDEPIYGQVAREMAGGAGWLTPHLNGALWFDKPPLFYWLSALSVSLFGANEFACRLPSALAATGLIGLVYALASYDFGRRVGLLSAIVMATCLQQIVLARAAVTDMTFVFCLTAALYGYRQWLGQVAVPRSTPATISMNRWALCCGLATGLAMLTKGPVAPFLLSLAFVLHLWWIGQLRRLRSIGALVAVATALLIGLPWYLAMYRLHGQEFVQGFLVANNITRFLKAEHAEQTGHWYSYFMNVPVLFLFFFPWSMFLPQAILILWRKVDAQHVDSYDQEKGEAETIGTRLALVWIAVIFVFFSISKTQLVTYIFPLYPCAAILVGVLWSRVDTNATAARAVRGGLRATVLLSVVLTVGLVLAMHKKHEAAQTTTLIAGVLLLLTSAVALWVMRRQKNPAVHVVPTARPQRQLPTPVGTLATGMICLTLWLIRGVLPNVIADKSTRDMVARLPAHPAHIAAFSVNVPSLMFYLRPQHQYLGLLKGSQVRQQLQASTPVFIVCRSSDESKLIGHGAREWGRSGKFVVLANAAALALSKEGSNAS